MAYAKLQQGCQDYAVCFQHVNQAIDNNDALKALYGVEHGVREPTAGLYGLSPWAIAGRHNAPQIAKTVLRVVVTTQAGGSVSGAPQVTGPAVLGVARVGTGQWLITIGKLGTWYALGQVENTREGQAVLYPVKPTDGSPQLLYVTTYDAWTATDMNFNVAIFGTPLT